MLQLKHQRKANKHLLERIAEIESKIRESSDQDQAELLLWPSQYLMKGYSNVEVDLEDSSKVSIL